jgi:hypothetical protein
MRKTPKTSTSRHGMTLVETAMVITVLVMLLFGIVEYCRLVYFRQLIHNAAREGARYAVVHTDEEDVEAKTIELVTKKMFGSDKSASGFVVQVYAGDKDANNVGTVEDARFGEYIVVQAECDYIPILPEFLFMGKTIHVRSRSLMNSEAN